jgi:GntR family transcriptional regulator/MocR family aminotransferase
MRALYVERQEALVTAAQRHLGWLEVAAYPTGLHLIGWLPAGVDDREVSRRAAELGVEAPPLSAYRMTPGARGGLVLGFAGSDPGRIRQAVRKLAALRSFTVIPGDQ